MNIQQGCRGIIITWERTIGLGESGWAGTAFIVGTHLARTTSLLHHCAQPDCCGRGELLAAAAGVVVVVPPFPWTTVDVAAAGAPVPLTVTDVVPLPLLAAPDAGVDACVPV